MRQIIPEGDLKFEFIPGALACKYDTWPFYRNQFQNGCWQDNKAVDMLCLDSGMAWMIEVKDYRNNVRTKAIDLADEVAKKIRDSLAGIVCASMAATNETEKQFARKFLKAQKIRVLCHIEQPLKTSRLRPRAIEPDKLRQKLRTLLKAVDRHPLVVDKAALPAELPWRVT